MSVEPVNIEYISPQTIVETHAAGLIIRRDKNVVHLTIADLEELVRITMRAGILILKDQ